MNEQSRAKWKAFSNQKDTLQRHIARHTSCTNAKRTLCAQTLPPETQPLYIYQLTLPAPLTPPSSAQLPVPRLQLQSKARLTVALCIVVHYAASQAVESNVVYGALLQSTVSVAHCGRRVSKRRNRAQFVSLLTQVPRTPARNPTDNYHANHRRSHPCATRLCSLLPSEPPNADYPSPDVPAIPNSKPHHPRLSTSASIVTDTP